MILLLLLYFYFYYIFCYSITFCAGIHITLTVFLHLFICVQVHVGECVPWCMFEGQRTTCQSWFSAATMWDPVITLRSSGFTQWAVSPALFDFLLFLRQSLKYPWTQNVAKDHLGLLIFLVIPPKCWDYRHGLCMTPGSWGARHQAHSLAHARQALHQLNYITGQSLRFLNPGRLPLTI